MLARPISQSDNVVGQHLIEPHRRKRSQVSADRIGAPGVNGTAAAAVTSREAPNTMSLLAALA